MLVTEQGIRVLEIGCGAAGPTRLMAKTYPESMFTASDLSDNVLVKARDNCKGTIECVILYYDCQYEIVDKFLSE